MVSDKRHEGIQGLTVYTRRTLAADGETSLSTAVYCPVQERAVELAACEGCGRFHALHFDVPSRTTKVMCRCGEALPTLDEKASRHALSRGIDLTAPLVEIMAKDVDCVRSDVGVERVAALLLEREIGAISVVDEHGKAIGIVSRTDVLRFEHDQGGPLEAAPVTAGDVMTPLVLALHVTANVGQSAALMAYERVHQLPIVSDAGEVVGLVSSLDVLRWLSRRSGYLIPGDR